MVKLMEKFNLTLHFVTPDFTSEEEYHTFDTLSDALEEADETAFRTVGFPLEYWESIDFGDNNLLFYFYPNESDRTLRVKISILALCE